MSQNPETIFSPCRKWRYTLWRFWTNEPEDMFSPDPKKNKFCSGYVQFIGLNPSIADETQDDPTIRRCIGFAKAWGYGAFCMTNIFAWRDTDPNAMKAQADPVGPDNSKWLLEIANGAGIIICAWGRHGSHMGRDAHVIQLLLNANLGHKLHCLHKNSDGTPKHPLYIAGNTRPMKYALA